MPDPATDPARPARPGRRTTVLWASTGVAFAALVAAAVYKARPVLYPEVAVSSPLDPACDLRAGPCTARFPGGGEVRFGIEPRILRVMEPLRILAELAGIDAGTVEADFTGADMNMGYNRVTLHQTVAGRYEGKGMLPQCVHRRMRWEAKVMLHTPAGIWVAPFRFETVRPGASE